jgi:hypothetical protein
MPLRPVVAAALAVVCHGALAQTTVHPTVSVQQIAPQLVTFAGSQLNFQSLVNGLAQGTQVQLVSVLPTGQTQTVTFTPATTLSPSQIAQVLEGARQQLIGLGIATPTAEQLGTALLGGTVPTALGGSQVAGALNANPPSPAAQIQGSSTAGAGASASSPARQIQVQTQPSGSSPVPGNVSDSPFPRNVSDSPIAPGVTSRSQVTGVSASPAPVVPLRQPGIGSTAPAAERVAPGTPQARH